MSAAKPTREYTFKELKEKSELALKDPKLIEIVKNASLNKDGRVNLTNVRNQAFEYVYKETGDLQQAEKLAKATRFLAMIRRDFEKDFERLVSQREPEKKVEKVAEPKRKFHEIEFELPDGVELITREESRSRNNSKRYSIRFLDSSMHVLTVSRRAAKEFCVEILNALLETAYNSEPYPLDDLGNGPIADELIKILEEKFGLKIKMCRNCNWFFQFVSPDPTSKGECDIIKGATKLFETPDKVVNQLDSCECWTSKGVSEEKVYCRDCKYYCWIGLCEKSKEKGYRRPYHTFRDEPRVCEFWEPKEVSEGSTEQTQN